MAMSTDSGSRNVSPGMDEQMRFRDLDSPAVCREAEEAGDERVSNFAVLFGHDTAKVAYGITEAGCRDLLASPPEPGQVRWINIWTPSGQSGLVQAIGRHYGFSPRLQTLMVAPSLPPRRGLGTASESNGDTTRKRQDVELNMVELRASFRAQRDDDLAMYKLVKESFNYTSIDYGDTFICASANWLHRRPTRTGPRAGADDESRSSLTTSLVPPKHWCWLAFCADNTVVSVHEDPCYEEPPSGSTNRDEWRAQELRNMRFNTISVLMQLSLSCPDEYKKPILSQKPVRQWMARHDIAGDVDKMAREGASSLFYYLFEDYGATAPILRQARQILDDQTDMIFQQSRRTGTSASKKAVHIIPQLHSLGKELRQLQHLYEGYRGLIQRILKLSEDKQISASTLPVVRPFLSTPTKLSESARNRFERLADRLQMLMLNTIEEYLEEKNALSDTFFNLTNQKDSQATARLTRSAALLAKFSVFFLPISFITSYFSVEIPGFLDSYTPKTYWVTFIIVIGVSTLSIFFFGRLLMFMTEILEDWATSSLRQARVKLGRLMPSHRDPDQVVD